MDNMRGVGNLSDSDDDIDLDEDYVPGSDSLSGNDAKKLPIFAYKDEIIEKVKATQFLVIRGETGCGKTTQIPQYLHQAGLTRDGMIGITQPRRIAATSVAKRVALEMNCALGHEVGYEIRFERRLGASTRIKYMTDGILLNECIRDPELHEYSVLIVDEAHERSVTSDVLVGLLKRICSRNNKRSDLKVIVTSATISVDKFATFLGPDCDVLDVGGGLFDVQVVYNRFHEDFVKRSVAFAKKIHKEKPLPGDILVFLTGEEEIEECCSKLRDQAGLTVFALYGAMDFELQMDIFKPVEGQRKVVVATNIAETSITIPGIQYVVDCGYVKQTIFSYQRGIESLETVKISKAQAQQRKGRAGRTQDGFCYRLYTEETYNGFRDELEPEIFRKSFDETFLRLKSLNIDPVNFSFLDAPGEHALIYCEAKLKQMRLLDKEGKITETGRTLSQLPIEPIRGMAILSGLANKCTKEVVAIISMFEEKYIFVQTRSPEAQERHKLFHDPDGDHFTLLYIFREFQRLIPRDRLRFCRQNFLSYPTMVKIEQIYRQLCELLHRSQINFDDRHQSSSDSRSSPETKRAIRSAFVEGYFRNICFKGNLDSYRCPAIGETCYLHRNSCLFQRPPKILVFNDLLRTTKIFMHGVMQLDETFLREKFASRLQDIGFPENLDRLEFGV